MASPSVLFIGVGRMGALMAARLADAGIALAVTDLSPQALESFRARGIPAERDGADLPGDVVITMLPDDKQVHEALLGQAGACRRRERKLVIDMTSASPEGTRILATELAALGTALIDAPVSGGMAGARDGSLTAMVGGDSQAFTTALPLLQLICAKVFHVGPVGSGHIVKALNNYLSAATLWTATEALVIGARLGLDPATMLAVWDAGSGKSHATEVKLPRHVLTRRFDFGQSLAFFCKDIAIATALAEEANVETPALDAILANWRHARDALGTQDDITAIARLIEDSARSSD
jgi:3-hydroxyisobutyrate dehydrogenase